MPEKFVGIDIFHRLAGVHDHHLVGHLPDDAHVVGDEDDAGIVAPLHLVDQPQDLRLDGHVQGGRRLIANQDGRVVAQGHGDDDTLAHASGELTGNRVEYLLRHRDADLPDQLESTGISLFPADGVVVGKDGLGNLGTASHQRVQAGHRLLENQRDLLAAVPGKFPLGKPDQFVAMQLDAATGDSPRFGNHLQDSVDGHALATARLADDAKRLSPLQSEADIIDGGNGRLILEKGDGKVLDRQDNIAHGRSPTF